GVHVAVFQSTAQKEAYEKARKGGAPTAGDALAWTKVDMDKDLRKTITVPAGASGVVRIGWKAVKVEPELLRLRAKVWNRAARGQLPSFQDLEVLVSYVRPALFDQERVDLGSLNPGATATASLRCWSATRDLEIQPDKADKRIKVELRPLTEEE